MFSQWSTSIIDRMKNYYGNAGVELIGTDGKGKKSLKKLLMTCKAGNVLSAVPWTSSNNFKRNSMT